MRRGGPGGHSRGGPPRGRTPMGGRGNMHRPLMGGNMYNRPIGGAPMGGHHSPNPIFTLVIVGIMLIAGAITALGDDILWIVLVIGVVAIVGMILNYKYKTDRAEATETEKMLNIDLDKVGTTSREVENLADKYKD